MIQSVVSDRNKWLTFDIIDYYLNTPLPRPEYLRISSKFLPPEVVETHNLYTLTIDWTGSKYLGFSITFDSFQRTVMLSMPGYIAKVLQRFAPSLTVGANSPALYVSPTYGVGQQTPHFDGSTRLSTTETTTLQEIIRSLLYYSRGADVTILPAVTHLSSLQAQPTQEVLKVAYRVLAYC